jgi:hypothetical protein
MLVTLMLPVAGSVQTETAIGAARTGLAAAPAKNIRVAAFIFTNMACGVTTWHLRETL